MATLQRNPLTLMAWGVTWLPLSNVVESSTAVLGSVLGQYSPERNFIRGSFTQEKGICSKGFYWTSVEQKIEIMARSIFDEVITHSIFQQRILYQLPYKVIEVIAPNKTHWIKNSIALTARIILSGKFFSHIRNEAKPPPLSKEAKQSLKLEEARDLGFGMLSSYIFERSGGIWTSMGFSIARNILHDHVFSPACTSDNNTHQTK